MAGGHEGCMWGMGGPFPLEVGSREGLENFFFNFQVKMQGFMDFYCEKVLVAVNRDREGA